MNPGCAAEQHAWREVKDGWRPLYGDVDKIGVAVEWHDFRTERSFDWGRTFHPNSLEFCLNLDGHGAVGTERRARSDYVPGNCGYYAIAGEPLPASRRAHDHHQFVTLEFSREHLQKQFVRNETDLEPQIRRIVFGDKDENVVAPARPMTMQQRSVVASLVEPPVAKAAQILWYQGKALELMAHFLFAPKNPEFFCMRQKRVARERVERSKELLSRDLANPPTLEMIGQEVGCSPLYLSRIFSREVERNAAHFLPYHFQCRRISQVAGEQLFRALDTFTGDAFLPHTEKFRVLWREKKMRHEFQGFALVPENLGCLCYRRLYQTGDDAALLHRHRARRCDYVFVFVSEYDPANLRLEVGFIPHKLFLQMFPREFQRHELVMIVCAPRRRQRFARDRIITTIARNIIASRATFSAYCSVPIEVQAELQAVRMESAPPVKRTLSTKIVPLHGDPDFIHVTIQGAPSIFNFTPGMLFGCAARIHVAQLPMLPSRMQGWLLLLQRSTVPFSQFRRGVVRALRKIEKDVIRLLSSAHRVVR